MYRKVHLYDAFGQRESDRLEPGPADAPPLVLDVGGLRFGVMTCYDLRFPESARRLVDAGAEVLVVPGGVGRRRAQGDALARRSRSPGRSRTLRRASPSGRRARGVVGRSLVVGPDGVVGLELDDEPGCGRSTSTARRCAAVRERNPSLANRRYAVVPRLTSRAGPVDAGASGATP